MVALHVVSWPGIPSWDRVEPAVALLAAYAHIGPAERVLILQCGNGALGAWGTGAAGCSDVHLRDTSVIAVESARATLAANALACASIEPGYGVDPAADGTFDVVLLPAPQGRVFSRLLILSAYTALRPGGRLYLAGPNRGGIKSVIADTAELFGNAEVIAYKKGNRVALAVKPHLRTDLPEAFAIPGLARGTFYEFNVTVRGETFHIRSKPGVFSWDHLDDGTAMLLDAMIEVRKTATVLDLGCGYGIIGLVAAKLASAGHVYFVDSDVLAVESARASIAANGFTNCTVVLGDGLAAMAGQRFDLIASNPPFHAGLVVEYDVAHQFIRDSKKALRPGGELLLVANRFIPYDRTMREVFGEAETVCADSRYRVLRAKKRYHSKVS